MIAIAGPSASKSFTLPEISTAPSNTPIHPLRTAPSENALSLPSAYHFPLAQIPKQTAPPKTISKEAVSRKAGIFAEIAAPVTATNKRIAMQVLRFIVYF